MRSAAMLQKWLRENCLIIYCACLTVIKSTSSSLVSAMVRALSNNEASASLLTIVSAGGSAKAFVSLSNNKSTSPALLSSVQVVSRALYLACRLTADSIRNKWPSSYGVWTWLIIDLSLSSRTHCSIQSNTTKSADSTYLVAHTCITNLKQQRERRMAPIIYEVFCVT